ncbi:MAG TPA: DUF4197 domain-containing protein [Oceanospirillales bacterium]|nr:DUF4197 domain-containing protein [Oceanospirillales bacterium]
MYKINKLMLLTLIVVSITFSTANAKNKWWKKILGDNKKTSSELSTDDIGVAFKQALSIGAENVVSQLGKKDGFNADEAIHIPLPRNLEKVRKILKKVGMSGMVDDLEVKLNRAAEVATPVAKNLFVQSIKDMTFDDVKKIYKGPDDSATQYFKEKMSASLTEKMNPIVENSLADVGAVQSLNKVMDKYDNIPFVSSVKPDLTGYVVGKAMDGIFYYLAQQEAEIRKNPLKQTTALLKKVFGK